MTLTDVNLLLYAYDSSASHHARAKAWLEGQLSGAETFAFAWVVVLAFVRLATSPRVFASPLDPDDALDLVESWLDQPCATVVDPGRKHTALLRRMLAHVGTAGNLTTDAHLAALAIEHGARLCSADADFGRFPGLSWTNPLAAT